MSISITIQINVGQRSSSVWVKIKRRKRRCRNLDIVINNNGSKQGQSRHNDITIQYVTWFGCIHCRRRGVTGKFIEFTVRSWKHRIQHGITGNITLCNWKHYLLKITWCKFKHYLPRTSLCNCNYYLPKLPWCNWKLYRRYHGVTRNITENSMM